MKLTIDALERVGERYESRARNQAEHPRDEVTVQHAARSAYLSKELSKGKARALAAEAGATTGGAQIETLKLLAQERIIGNDDDLRDINYLELAIAVARGVALVRLSDGAGTGVLVGPGLFMTNHHVLDSTSTARSAAIQLDYQQDASGAALPIQSFRLEPDRFFVTDPELDFTIVAVASTSDRGRPLSDYPWVKLIGKVGKAEVGDAVNIIQHPRGGPKQIAFRNNRVLSIPAEKADFLYYSTDTEPGSSGSPCFNDQWELIALHHSGVPKLDSDGSVLKRDDSVFRPGVDPESEIAWIANEGARVSAILAALSKHELTGEAARLCDGLLGASPNPVELSRSAGLVSATDGTGAAPTRAQLNELYRGLGYDGPPPLRSGLESFVLPGSPGVRAEGEKVGAEPPPLDGPTLEILQERFRSDPDEVLARARQVWDPQMSAEDLQRAIDEAAALVRAPRLGLERVHSLSNHQRAASKKLPPEFFQDWPYVDSIPIDPSNTRFETRADAANWILFSGPALIGSWFAKKAPFAWHHLHASHFTYEVSAPRPGAATRMALVSDFGTGLYHSKYIAKHIYDEKYPFVVHGGDVYYAGRDSEFRSNFKPQIDPLLGRGAQVFTMNANHEMYSFGKPYFDYLSERRTRDPKQLQEGSYFSLRFGSTLQLVGIDTAYFRDGRHDEPSLQRWLTDNLRWGRERGALNVLFSPNEPYSYGGTGLTALLTKDLASLVLDQKLVDLWFWGNTHYCALFDRAPTLPFIGSCIGHGGYPYDRMQAGMPSAAPVRFLETGARFPAYTEVRQDRGNNGFCELVVNDEGQVSLTYLDWMKRVRCRARVERKSGVAQLTVL